MTEFGAPPSPRRLPAPFAHAPQGNLCDVHTLSAECEQLSSKVHGQSPTGSEGGALGQGYLNLCFILPASFLYLFLMLARRGCMVRRHLVFGLVALAHGVTADRALQLPSPPPPASHGGRQLSAPACRSTPNASNSSWSNGLMVECTDSVVDWSNASNRSHLSNASNASSPHVLQPSAPSAPPHPPCGCQHISVTGAESVQSNRMGIYTRTNEFVGARQLYQRGSPASLQYLYYDTRCACSTPPHARVTRSAHTQHRPPAQTPAHTCRIYSHGLAVAIVAAAKAGRSTKRPTGSLESTDQRARPPAHTRRMALGPRGMAAPSAATMASRWSA